jgi:TP901 family phage tail tape measure protein
MLKNVSEAGATAEGSANTLIATMKAFKLEAGDSQHVVDALNEVSNKYAVSVNDLSTAIRKSSASMAAGNNSLEQTFGLVTAGTEILREPGRVANGLSTITARLTKKNDEYIASITGGMGTIDKNTGELRSTYDILLDLSKQWEHLTSVEKQELTETVAGKTQRALFTALMQNFSTAVGASEAALNSEGSAATENAKRMDSLNGKVQQLQSAWQSFSKNTIDSSFIKNILSSLTELIKFIDKIGGLPTVLATATSALLLFKGGLILDKTFKAFSSGVSLIRNGLVTLITALPNAVSAFNAFSAGIISAGTAIEAAVPLLSLIALTITGVVAGIKAFTKAQKEATSAAIENSQSAEQSIANNKEKQKTLEKEIDTLKKERDTYINSADASKDLNNDSIVESKNEEIAKRETNIEKIKEENKEYLNQREAAARSMTTNKADSTGLGWNQLYGASNQKEADTLRENIKSINKELKDAEGNTGAYKRKLEELRGEYEKQAKKREENGETAEAETETIKALNKELEHNSKKYEEDKKTADEFYDILKSGGNISNDNIEWLKKFYNLSDDQINQLKEGIDVKNSDSESTNAQTEAQQKLNEALADSQKKQSDYDSIVDDSINKLVSYSDNVSLLTQAQDMLTDSGHLTAEMYQQLANNDLLQYLDVVNGKLQVNKDAFDGSSQAALDNATQAVKDSLAQELLQIALADQNGTLNETATKLGLVKSKSEGVDTTKAVEQILKIGSVASTSKAELGALFQTMEKGKEVNADYTPSSEAANLMNQAIDRANKKIAAIKSISLGNFKSSGSRKKSGSGSKSSTKSTKEEYKAEIDTLYKYKNALDNAKESVDKIQDALKNTDNLNEQEKYTRQLIDALNNEINKTNELKAAQTRQINGYINQLRAQGFAIDYNSSKNELYINNMQHLADFSGDTAKNLEKLIKKIQDLNDDNRSLDGSVRDLTGDVKDYYKQLEDIPEKKLKKFNELMEEFQQNRLDQIQNQIDDIQHEMDNDPRLKQLENQIEALENQNDELDKQKELEEKLLAVEEAKEKLANANRQKTLQVYREGQGFVWETDPDTIKDAADELKQAQDDLNDKIKQDQIDQLNAEKEALEKSYQDRIDALQDFLDEQNYQIDKANREGIKSFQDLQKEMAKYGVDSAEYLGKATDWLNNYNKSLVDLNNTVSGILSGSTKATDGLIYSSAVQDKINQALSNIIPTISSTGISLNQIDYDKIKGNTDNQSIYINNIELPNVKDIDDFVEALKDLPRMAATQSTMRK